MVDDCECIFANTNKLYIFSNLLPAKQSLSLKYLYLSSILLLCQVLRNSLSQLQLPEFSHSQDETGSFCCCCQKENTTCMRIFLFFFFVTTVNLSGWSCHGRNMTHIRICFIFIEVSQSTGNYYLAGTLAFISHLKSTLFLRYCHHKSFVLMHPSMSDDLKLVSVRQPF